MIKQGPLPHPPHTPFATQPLCVACPCCCKRAPIRESAQNRVTTVYEHDLHRENQDLEQNRIQMEMQTAAIQKEKEAFQQEALDLAKRLEAVIHDKFIPKSHIDADTPIDKTLNFLHAFVAVCTFAQLTLIVIH